MFSTIAARKSILLCLLGFLLTGCSTPATPTPEVIFQDVTRIVEITSTPQVVEVTRVVQIDQLVEVTAAPTPGLADDCYKKAETQLEMNECAVIESMAPLLVQSCQTGMVIHRTEEIKNAFLFLE